MPTIYTGGELCQERYTVTAAALTSGSGTVQLSAKPFPPGRVTAVTVVKKTAFNTGTVFFNVAADSSETIASATEVASTSVSPDTVECAAWKTNLNSLLRASDKYIYAKSTGTLSAGEMDLIITYAPASPEY